MVDTKVIKAKMILLDISDDALAEYLNISKKTLRERFKRKEFAYTELEPLTKLLKIGDPWNVFFSKERNTSTA